MLPSPAWNEVKMFTFFFFFKGTKVNLKTHNIKVCFFLKMESSLIKMNGSSNLTRRNNIVISKHIL